MTVAARELYDCHLDAAQSPPETAAAATLEQLLVLRGLLTKEAFHTAVEALAGTHSDGSDLLSQSTPDVQQQAFFVAMGTDSRFNAILVYALVILSHHIDDVVDSPSSNTATLAIAVEKHFPSETHPQQLDASVINTAFEDVIELVGTAARNPKTFDIFV